MKKLLVTLALLLATIVPCIGMAAEISSDKMILEWTTKKVWNSDGDLCMSGYFKNQRQDLLITKVNRFIATVEFTKKDGSKFVVTCKPKKIPMCRIDGIGQKNMTFNLGPAPEAWENWVCEEYYDFTYIGLR